MTEEAKVSAAVTAAVKAVAQLERAAGAAVAAAQAAAAEIVDKAPKAGSGIIGKAKGAAADLLSRDTVHVDLVKNEWLAGYQVVVARVSVGSAGLKVDASNPSWEQVVLRADDVSPEAEPEAFLAHLSARIHGTYLFATEPHAESACPYHDLVVRMQSTGESRTHSQAV